MTNENIFEQAKELAEKIRRNLKLGNAPVKNIFNLLEDQGIFVVRMPINGDGLDGAFYYDKINKSAKILINNNRSHGKQIFTAAHEFCHYLLDREDQIIIEHEGQEKSPREKRADAFAANFLLPEEGIRFYTQNVLKKTKKLDDDNLVKIQNEFKTSWSAIIYRLNNLGYVFDRGLKAKLDEISSLNFKAAQSGFDPEISTHNGKYEFPANFYRLAFSAYFEGKITLNRLSDILRQSQEDTKELVTKIKSAHA